MKLGFPRRRLAFCLSVYFATLSDRLRPSGFLHDLQLNRCSVVLRSLFFVVAMFGRKLYKTKLCLLFQRGRCPRQSCNFAHGEAELRRFSGSFSGRRDLRSADLRDKLDRRYSPHRRVSPGRVPRAQHSFRYQKPISRDRGSSLSRSPIRRSDRRHRKKHRTDGESDFSESFKASDGSEERKKEDKAPSYDDKDDLEEQLRQLQLDIEMLDDHKSQLESLLDEKINEAHKLSTRMEDLESQLNKEQEDYKRITSKIKKFIRAHGRYIKAQEELKRSQTRLQKIGDQFSSDTLKLNAYEDDPSANIISDGDPNADGNSRKRERDFEAPFRSEKSQRSERPAPMSETTIKRIETMKAILKRNTSQVEDYNHKQGRNASSIGSLDKYQGDDDEIDVEKVDSEMLDIDINSEVDIEQV